MFIDIRDGAIFNAPHRGVKIGGICPPYPIVLKYAVVTIQIISNV